jgi:RNA recognition motif-containing protein
MNRIVKKKEEIFFQLNLHPLFNLSLSLSLTHSLTHTKFIYIFSAETTESELCRVFSAYGNVKSTKIIVDRAGVSKGYGFVTFDTPAVIESLMVNFQN